MSRSTRMGRQRMRNVRRGATKTSMEKIIEFVVEELQRMESSCKSPSAPNELSI